MYILACQNDGDCGEATLGGTLRTQGCFQGVCRGKCFVLNDFTCLRKYTYLYTYIWYFHITIFTTLECTKDADCRAGLYCDSGHCRGKFSSWYLYCITSKLIILIFNISIIAMQIYFLFLG